jgi:hypothetical protein
MKTSKTFIVGLTTVALLFLLGLMVMPMVFAAGAGPTGASTLQQIVNETALNDTPLTAAAVAGNVSELIIAGFSTTQAWQGYFGNVTGTIQLADSEDNVLYNWSLASPEGEVFATMNDSIIWSEVQCFNFTSTGTHAGGETDGETSLFGTNLSGLEYQFNISYDDVDGINETFAFTQGGDGHDGFFVASNQFTAGECLMTHVYSDAGEGTTNEFEEVLLYEPTTSSIIFAAILEEASTLGFDDNDHDFEMLVLEDGHGTNTDLTTYYFFVELE